MAAEGDILDKVEAEIVELAVDEPSSELGEIVYVLEEARFVEIDESIEGVTEEGLSVLVRPEGLAEEAGSVELVEERGYVELEESAEVVSERLVEDEESKGILATLEILEPVKLVGDEESELIAEIVALVDGSVGELEVVAIVLEGLVLDTLATVDETGLTAGELKDMLAEDEISLSIEIEVVDDAEVGLTIEVREDGLELSGDVEDGLKLDDAGAALDVELVDMIKGMEDVEMDEGFEESADVELVV